MSVLKSNDHQVSGNIQILARNWLLENLKREKLTLCARINMCSSALVTVPSVHMHLYYSLNIQKLIGIKLYKGLFEDLPYYTFH